MKHANPPERPSADPCPPRLVFSVQLLATPRGARHARRLAVRRLAAWGWPPESPASHDTALLVAELAANAVLHGRLPHWYFSLRLTLAGEATLRVEVTDTRPDHRPPGPAGLDVPPPTAESGRGLLLVDVLADRWGVSDGDPFTKTVWCELDMNRPRL